MEDFSEEGWERLLDELDVDRDGKLSILELEALRRGQGEAMGNSNGAGFL